ncbi:hypothetical protein E2I00_011599, partial [Balaenoptera physalus]
PGPIRPIYLISDYFPHFYPFAEPPCAPETYALQSFDVCLERRRLTKRPESLDTARGMSLYEEVGRTVGPSEDWGGRSGVAQAEVCQAGIDVGWTGVQAQAGLEKLRPSRSAALYLHPNGGKKSKYKTSVREKTPNPEFNEEFLCAGPREELAQKTLLVSVWDGDPGTADDFTGRVQLNSRARGERQQHWRECLGRSDHQLELWHPLDGVPLQLSD